jgi:hypothetical protein
MNYPLFPLRCVLLFSIIIIQHRPSEKVMSLVALQLNALAGMRLHLGARRAAVHLLSFGLRYVFFAMNCVAGKKEKKRRKREMGVRCLFCAQSEIDRLVNLRLKAKRRPVMFSPQSIGTIPLGRMAQACAPRGWFSGVCCMACEMLQSMTVEGSFPVK